MAVLRLLLLKFKKVYFVVVFFWQFVSLECLMTSVTDMFPTVFRKGYRRELLLLCLCAVCFFLGLLLVTEVRDMWEGGSEHSHIPVNCISSSQPTFFCPVGWLVLPSTLWPLCLQWQQPSPSVSVSIHSDRMDIWLVTFCALLFHFSCGIRIVASVRPAKIIPSGEKIFS